MKYACNPALFSNTFAVPVALVDQHLRLANETLLKVLLWILRNNPFAPDPARMCEELKLDPKDAEDYLRFWVERGVLTVDGESPAPAEAPEQPLPAAETKPAVETPLKSESPQRDRPAKPTSEEIAVRLEESPEILQLFREAQRMLGKTIGYNGQCTLLQLYDHFGLPAEVIFMLLEYCSSIGKTNYSYLLAVGEDWGKREIDTLDKAAEMIADLRRANSLWTTLARANGLKHPRPSTNQSKFLQHWSRDLGFSEDMIQLAYEEMTDHTAKFSFKYINSVLENWHANGLKTPEDVEAFRSRPQAAAKAGTGKPKSKGMLAHAPSYDLDAFMTHALNDPIVYKKKRKNDT